MAYSVLLREIPRIAVHRGMNLSLANKVDALNTSFTLNKKPKKQQINILHRIYEWIPYMVL